MPEPQSIGPGDIVQANETAPWYDRFVVGLVRRIDGENARIYNFQESTDLEDDDWEIPVSSLVVVGRALFMPDGTPVPPRT